MASRKLSISDIVQMLPRTLQKRFDSLGGYVASIANRTDKQEHPLSEEQLRFVQLAALIYALDNFMRLGTAAAQSAAEAFEALGSPGFSVGRTIFTRDNDATMRGARLADGLKTALQGTKVLSRIQAATSMRDLVEDLAWRLRRGDTLD